MAEREAYLLWTQGLFAAYVRYVVDPEFGEILGEDSKQKYASFKQLVADRSPKELGTIVKASEVLFHHEVTNQMLWNQF